MKYKNVVIGAGPSGIMCALQLNNKDTLVIDGNKEILLKLKHSGGGRCNITNNDDYQTFFEKVNSDKFLMSTLSNFDNYSLKEYIESIGVKLKLEGKKYFPTTDNSTTIIDAISSEIKFDLKLSTTVMDVKKDGEDFVIHTDGGKVICENLIIASGGATYKQFGATKLAYQVANSFGIDVIKQYPTNTSLQTSKHNLMGISLQNAQIKYQNKIVEGDVLFTHFGITGPAIFELTSSNEYAGDLIINVLKMERQDALTFLKTSFNDSNKKVINQLASLAPQKYLEVVLGKLKELICNSITNEQFEIICDALTSYKLIVSNYFKFDSAFTTGGGISKKEISPKTFESKKINNLYFIGECLDVFAPTGGYNLTLYFSMGYSCGMQIKTTQ